MDRLKILSAFIILLALSIGCQVGNYHPGVPIPVPAMGTVSGVVRAASGATVPGAWVWDGRRKTVASPAGEFRLYNVEPGTVMLTAHSGETGATMEVSAAAGQETTVNLILAAGAVHGTVRSAATGLPLQGAAVALNGTDKIFTTYGDGRFFFATLAAGTRTVRACKDGYTASNFAVLSPEAGFSFANLDLVPK